MKHKIHEAKESPGVKKQERLKESPLIEAIDKMHKEKMKKGCK